LLYEALELSADAGMTLTVYNAEPGTGTDDALKLLASWAATTLTSPEDSGLLRDIHNN
jgi:hypothetical protein